MEAVAFVAVAAVCLVARARGAAPGIDLRISQSGLEYATPGFARAPGRTAGGGLAAGGWWSHTRCGGRGFHRNERMETAGKETGTRRAPRTTEDARGAGRDRRDGAGPPGATGEATGEGGAAREGCGDGGWDRRGHGGGGGAKRPRGSAGRPGTERPRAERRRRSRGDAIKPGAAGGTEEEDDSGRWPGGSGETQRRSGEVAQWSRGGPDTNARQEAQLRQGGVEGRRGGGGGD
uniref:Translation initiation factor IF-2-like n=1 Tax=Petromyzon marinus TaxID=7757 RepID=A0AAJ7UDI9_PETMA|nr:translation initiation factor IF-2-like [Petromyzon marinus]